MKKILLIIIAYTCLSSSCSGIPRSVRNAFTYCYTDTYTGIDTLINIEGYYPFPFIMFYDNGLVVYSYGNERFRNSKALFLKEVADDPETKDSKSFYDGADCGSYVVCGDTIKVQMIHAIYSRDDALIGMEDWYQIIDGNLHLLDAFPVTTNQKEKELWRKRFPIPAKAGAKMSFVPLPVKPPLDYYWILKEKWFWCNEQDWKEYMQKMEQKKIKKK